jgi:hypothetical protein
MSKKNGHKAIPDKQPTPALEWRRLVESDKRGYVVELASGMQVRLRPVSIERMLRSGQIPDELSPIAGKSIWSEFSEDSVGTSTNMVLGMFDLLDLICMAAIIEPKIVEDPQADDELSIDDLGTDEKYEVYQLVTQPGWVLRKFCEQQGANVASLPDGQDVRTTAVEPVT